MLATLTTERLEQYGYPTGAPQVKGWKRGNRKDLIRWVPSPSPRWQRYDYPKHTRPTQPTELEGAINDSKKILDLKDDFDEAGSPGYSPATWSRSITFLRKYYQLFERNFGKPLPTPKILPGPNGSIDLLWELKGVELLINIPPNSKKRAGFYGDRKDGTTIKGTLNPNYLSKGLLEWLMLRN